MRKKAEKSGVIIIVATLLLIAIFATAMIGSLLSIGADNGEIKTSRNLNGGLASAGAPRSQLALKQMFDSMGVVRTNGNRVIYEPITEEYLAAVLGKIENGEKPRLSVEEILYIISDSVSFIEKYDGVKLHGEGTVILKKGVGDKPAHISALEQSSAIYQIILYRIKSLCHESAFEYDGDTLVYYPDAVGERNRARRFEFSEFADDKRADNIVYCPGDGQRISLFPSADYKENDLKYMLLTDDPLSTYEREILETSGYDADRCRNITPSYWKGHTDCKAVIIGGRIIIVDSVSGKVTDSAPKGTRTLSIAAGDNDGDGRYELYFTAYSENKSVAVRYVPGSNVIDVLFETEFCIGAYEAFDSEEVNFYRTEQVESGSRLNLLRRIGNEINE